MIPRKPEWLKIRLPHGMKAAPVTSLLSCHHLHTICTSGMCPNRAECWERGTATFMIGGNICTRNCRFCNVTTGRPLPLDPKELDDIVESVKALKLRHVVITSVDRDDLKDCGATHWATLIHKIKESCPGVTMEVLIPDFKGQLDLVDKVIEAQPEVISHNLETVRRLTPDVRCFATYDNSLKVLKHVADSGIIAKSGIMLGLGETKDEILQTMDDLLAIGCKVMTIGQYLQPTEQHFPVKEYVTPEQFEVYRLIGIEKGFDHIESAPLVRSSYHAEQCLQPKSHTHA